MDTKFPRYISHSPLGEDQFECGSQERLAECITKEITSQEPSNKKRLIGIDGPWGSGKSNIVEILKGNLENEYHFFIYDAWGHQEDAHRRAILEELINDLIDNKLLPEKKAPVKTLSGEIEKLSWKQRLGYLLAQKRETLLSEIPHLNWPIAASVLLIYLTPIIKDTFNSWSALFLWLLLLSAVIIANKGRKPKEVLAIFQGKPLSFTRYEVISDDGPSAPQFKQWMEDLSYAIQASNKKLVIVFDNMDRLRPDQIKELWGTIHTFFAEGHGEYPNIWVIVPFDRTHLQKAFMPKANSNNGLEEANQFINKSFSVVYRVAPPVLTDWKQFYNTKFREAFGDTEPDEQRETTLRLFDLLKPRFTPRDVIAFINELVTLKKLWGDKIELKYMALFTLQAQKLSDNPAEAILENKCLETKGVSKYFPDTEALQKNLAALVYNIPPDEAYQLVMYREIERGLREGDATSIKPEMLENRHFVSLLEDVVEKAEFELVSAIAALDKIGIENETNLSLPNVWQKLLARALHEPMPKIEFSNAQKTLLRNLDESGRAELARHLCQEYSNLIQQPESNSDGGDLYAALSGLQNALSELGSDLDVSSLFPKTKVAPGAFMAYLHSAKEAYADYPVHCPPEELDAYCSDLDLPDDLRYLTALKFLKTNQGFIFEQTQEALNGLMEEESISAKNFGDYLEVQKAIAKEKPIEKFDIPLLYDLLRQVPEDAPGYHDLLAMRLCYGAAFQTLILQQVTPINQPKPDPAATLLASDDESLSKSIAEVIEYYGSYGDLLVLLPSWPQPLLKSVLSNLTETPVGPSRIEDIVSVLYAYDKIFEQLDVSGAAFLERLDGWHKFAKEKLDPENINEIPALFFEHAVETKNELSKLVIGLELEYLKGLSEDGWNETFIDEGDPDYQITRVLLKSGHMNTLPDNAVRAYKELLKQMAEGQIPLDENFAGIFYDRIHKNKLKSTLKDIRDGFINHWEITSELFMFFMPMLLANADLNDKAGDVCRRILAPVVSDEDCLQFIVDNKGSFIPLIRKAGDDAEDFKDKLRRLAEDSENEDLVDFARRIDILKP